MDIRPVRRYSQPRYPTNRILQEHPELLRLIPKRWQGNRVLIAALTGVCVLMTSSRALSASKPRTPASRVAPIFQHGDGVGSYGCIATAAPVFLSEDEARRIITDEGKRAGLTFAAGTSTLKNVSAPLIEALDMQVTRKGEKLGKIPAKYKTRKRDIKLDGEDKKRKISFEFVSLEDFDKWSVEDPVMVASVAWHDILGTAALFRESLAKSKPQGTYGVFYDPVYYTGFRFEEQGLSADAAARDKAEREQAEKNLRAQVKDFVKWLKAQGVV